MPPATIVVATPIRQWPHIGTYSSCSMMMIEKSAPSLIGGISRTEHIMPWPRGSKLSRRRRSSSLRHTHSRRSRSVRPGGTGTPPTITRVELPSVWELMVWINSRNSAVRTHSCGHRASIRLRFPRSGPLQLTTCQIVEHSAGGVVAGRAIDVAAGMRAGAAEIRVHAACRVAAEDRGSGGSTAPGRASARYERFGRR